MEIILSVVTSANGLTTKGNEGPASWASVGDQKSFENLKDSANVLIMGSATYQASRRLIRANLGPQLSRIVMTRDPNSYQNDAVVRWLEFTNLSPTQLVEKLKEQGVRRVILASGAKVTGAFFREGLIDTMYQSVEPVIFNSGNPIAENIGTIAMALRHGYPIIIDKTPIFCYDIIKKPK